MYFKLSFKATLTASLTSIQVSIITLSLEIVKVQASLALLTGFPLPLASLDILQISLSTGEISLVLSTFTVPAALTAAEKVSKQYFFAFLYNTFYP